jgi:hypothetical protein
MNKIELSQSEFETLENVLKFFIYQPVPFYKGSLDDIKNCESILFKKMKVNEFCLIRGK